MSLVGNSNEEKVWNYLKSKGLNDYGVAGCMGNLYAEAGFKPTNMQNSYEKKLGYTDATYTSAIDDGTYTKIQFAYDKAGYGICQWTYWSRKRSLYEFAKSQNKSIGDLEMQLDFMYKELSEGYPSVLRTLKDATSVLEASNAMLLKYEKPANQSEENQNKRASYGQKYYDKYHKEMSVEGDDKMAYVQKFTNSPLVSHTKISPNKTSPRTHVIDTITIHCFVGQVSATTIGNCFAPTSKKASCNYGVAYDGKICLVVDERDRSWCSSNSANDNRAVTIEVACEPKYPYEVNDAAMKSLIELVADICKRNNIKELKWQGDKSLIGKVDKQNMTVHRWFKNKECPGKYLYDKHPYIVQEVNKKLGVPVVKVEYDYLEGISKFEKGDEVKLIKGATYYNGKPIPSWLFNRTLYVRKVDGSNVTVSIYKTGAITGVVKIHNLKFAKTNENESDVAPIVPVVVSFEKGDVVKLVKGAKYTNGKSIPAWLFVKKLYVRSVSGDNISVSWLKTGAITGIVNKKYLTKL